MEVIISDEIVVIVLYVDLVSLKCKFKLIIFPVKQKLNSAFLYSDHVICNENDFRQCI